MFKYFYITYGEEMHMYWLECYETGTKFEKQFQESMLFYSRTTSYPSLCFYMLNVSLNP